MPVPESLRLAILITDAPASDLRGTVARRIVRAAARTGHQLLPVLFYEDGAYTVLPSACRDRWVRLASATGITLAVCPAAAERRGLTAGNTDPDPFVFQGLLAWLGEALEADRLLTF